MNKLTDNEKATLLRVLEDESGVNEEMADKCNRRAKDCQAEDPARAKGLYIQAMPYESAKMELDLIIEKLNLRNREFPHG